MKLKTKNITLDAFRWDESQDTFETIEINGVLVVSFETIHRDPEWIKLLKVRTIRGDIKPEVGDYIVKYDTGEVDIVKEDEFNLLFEENA